MVVWTLLYRSTVTLTYPLLLLDTAIYTSSLQNVEFGAGACPSLWARVQRVRHVAMSAR